MDKIFKINILNLNIKGTYQNGDQHLCRQKKKPTIFPRFTLIDTWLTSGTLFSHIKLQKKNLHI